MKQGWEIKKLGEVCDVIGGGTPSKKNLKFYEGDILWATVRDMKSEVISDTEFKITEEAVKKSSTNVIPKGNVIIATRVGLGKVCLIEKDTAINQDLRGIVPKKFKQLDTGFLFQWFKSISHLIVEEGTGATVQGVKLPFIKDLPIPLPPLPEQQRIVSILDETFSAIDKAKANAEQNLKNAKELFESYLQGVFDPSTRSGQGKGDGWEIKTLGEVSKINYGYTEKASFDEVGPKFLRITDIQENGVDWDTVPYCKCSDKDLPKYKLEKGDIVFARTGATTGKSYLIDNPPISVFASYLIRLRMNSINEFIPEFIYYFFQTKTYWDKINAGISGSAQGGFNATKLGELEFHFPKSKTEQQTIVRQLDALRAETQKLEAVYQKKIDDLEELKKSILQKAFAGELKTEKAVAV